MKRITLGRCADVKISGVDKNTYESETLVRLCNYTDVYYNWAITDNHYDGFMRASATESEIGKFKVRKGQVALTKDSETREDIGKPALIASDFDDVVLGYHCALITPDDSQLDGKYLNALLNTAYVKRFFANNAGGSGQRYYLSETNIKDLPLFLPDLPDQKKIGKFLSSVDRLIELSRKRIENLEKLAKEIYDYWFVQFDFPDKNGKPYKTSGGKMVYNAELKREIPVGWKVGRLSSIASFVDDGVKSDLIDAFHYVTTDSLLQGKAGRRIVDNLPVTTITLTKFKPLDVLVSNIRVYLKKIWFADCCGGCSHDVLVFRAKVVPSEYLYSFLRKDLFFDYVSSAAKGSKMPRGDKAHIMRMPITIPDNTLLKQFSDIVKEYKGGMTCSTKMIDELTQLREFLLPLLMNGQAKMR